MTERIKSPFLYFGGKGRRVARILPLLPQRAIYVEPFCGAANLFFTKEPSPVEVLNDINKDIINFFRCLQQKDTYEELRFRLMATPYARDAFIEAGKMLDTDSPLPDVDKAWAFFVISNQGFSGSGALAPQYRKSSNWGRTFGQDRGTAKSVNQWLMRLSMLDAVRWRLMMAQIDSCDGLEAIAYWDSPDTVFYIDPPYVLETRQRYFYPHEMSNDQHAELVEKLCNLKGAAVVSGYSHPLYTPLDRYGYQRHEFQVVCDAAVKTRNSGLQGKGAAMSKVPRTEVVWVKS